MEIINNEEFLQKIKDMDSKGNMLIFGDAGIGGLSIVREYIRKKNEQIWDLKEDYSNLQKENERLTTQLDIANTKEERLTQIIQILSEAYRRQTHLPSATAALAWSKEAETISYRDMKVLETILENIEKGGDKL